MLNKKTYEVLNRIKENTPDDYEIIQSSIDELLNELSFTSHEIKNHISFLALINLWNIVTQKLLKANFGLTWAILLIIL